jgi:general secretion pathway protein L
LHLVVALPDQAEFPTDTAAAWWLLGQDGSPLREGRGPLDSAPRAERVIVTVPATRIVFIETPLPNMTGEKRDALVRYAIEDKLTIDPSTVHAIIVGRMAGDEATANHVVAAIDRGWLAAALRWLHADGRHPVLAAADTESIHVAADQWTVVVDTRHGIAKRPDGLVYAFDSGLSGEPPFALSLALREARARNTAPSSLLLQAGDPAAMASLTAELATRWASSLETKISLGPVLTTAERNRRLVNSKSAKQANFLAGEFAPAGTGAAWAATFKPAVMIFCLIVAAQFLFTVTDGWRLDRQRRALNDEMVQVFKSAFPQAQAVVDPPLQMTRNLEQLKRERGMVNSEPMRAQLARLAELTRGLSALRVTSVELYEGTATLRGELSDAGAANALRQRAGAANAQLDIKADKDVVLVLKGSP